jgi:nucleotide-binding universal stress UspA family protein
MPERTIIAGYDGREQGLDGLALASLLARRPGTRLIVVAIYPLEPRGYRSGEYQDALRTIAESNLMNAARRIPYGVRFETKAIAARHPDQALAELAEAEQAEALVLGSSHRGPVGSVLLGSVSEYLSRHASCGVVIAPRGYGESVTALRTIAVAFDGGPESWQALHTAADLAKGVGARLRLLSVVGTPGPGYGTVISAFTQGNLSGTRHELLRAAIDEARAALDPTLDVSSQVLSGPPADRILEACGGDVDLLVTGSRGYGPLRRTLLGGVSAALMRSARCPVFVVPKSSVAGGTRAAA